MKTAAEPVAVLGNFKFRLSRIREGVSEELGP